MSDTVTSLLAEIAGVGTDPIRGGYSRPVYSPAELELRSWFIEHALKRGLDVETDANGILWAWHSTHGDRTNAVVTGSHLDSVPGGGAFDGPLGVASALIGFDRLAAQGIEGRPRAIAVFPEEEGSRFGLACLGSQLMTGAVSAERVLGLQDIDGLTFAEVADRNGLDPSRIGPDHEALARMGNFVELHVEQGRGLVELSAPVAVASSILGHGRWRMTFRGEGNHAGATLMSDRRDPMVAAAKVVIEAQRIARGVPYARATVGRLTPTPGGTNVIASQADLWLDVRHPEDELARYVVREIVEAAHRASLDEGCTVSVAEESYSQTVSFDAGLRDHLVRELGSVPVLETGAGHDAGVLKEHVPTAMLFVRNPTGVSHSPYEHAEPSDMEAGANALATVLQSLVTRDSDLHADHQ